MQASQEVLRKIEENRDKIKRSGVKRIGLFGSYARGEQREESDVRSIRIDYIRKEIEENVVYAL